MNIDYHIKIMESANINFLLGSGLSRPFLPTLGNIENLIYGLDTKTDISEDLKLFVRGCLFNKYFESVMYPNKCILEKCHSADRIKCHENYKYFLQTLNKLLQKRGSTIISKQCNIFTTNIDLFLESAIEELDVEFNDGFSGRIKPHFSLSNFHRSVTRCSHHFENESKMPVFNLLKIHGSLNWRRDKNDIYCSFDTSLLDQIHSQKDNCKFLAIEDTISLEAIIESIDPATINIENTKQYLELFAQLPLINPTKQKFAETTLGLYYYELLRYLSNQLEKDNSVLYIMGFSMADEHIREIILRAAKSNPTLHIYIIAFDSDAEIQIKDNLNNLELLNIEYIVPSEESEVYSFDQINKKVFSQILNKMG